MKLNKLVLLAPVALFSLSSCAKLNQRHNIEEYFISYTHAKNAKELGTAGEFNILQLSDLHMSMMSDSKVHYQFIKKTIDEAKHITNDNLHLIVITGDLFTFADKSTVKELCDFFEAQETPWTLTFGNHDEQGYFSIDWLTGYLNDLYKKPGSNLLFRDIQNDDVFGNANFVIDLPIYEYEETTGTIKQHRQIVMLDSNRYNYGEGYGYDYIHYDQIDWYKRVCEYAYENDDDDYDDFPTNSLAFFHIPIPEFADSYESAKVGTSSYFLPSYLYSYENGKWSDTPQHIEKRNVRNDTSDGAPGVNTGFFETALKSGYVKGMFVGHAHTNTHCVEYIPSSENKGSAESIALCYGVKSTDRIYCDENMLGGQLIHYYGKEGIEPVVPDSNASGKNWFNLDLIYHKYSDLKEGK